MRSTVTKTTQAVIRATLPLLSRGSLIALGFATGFLLHQGLGL